MDDFHKGEIKNWLENYNGDDEDDENDSPFFPDVSSDEDSDSDIDDDDELDEYYEIPYEEVQELESDEEAEGGIMDINEEEGEDEEEDVNTDIVEEESEPEDFDEDGLFMLTHAAEQYNIFRKNNARLASTTTMNEISKNNKNKK